MAYCLFMNCYITNNNEKYRPKTEEKKRIIILGKQLVRNIQCSMFDQQAVFSRSSFKYSLKLLQIKKFIYFFLPNQKINHNSILSRSIQHFYYPHGCIIYCFGFLVSVTFFFHPSLTDGNNCAGGLSVKISFFNEFYYAK